MPALLNSTSIVPYSARTAANISRTASSSATSQASARSTSGESSRRSTPTTVAPSSLKRRTVSAPMPLAAPVTTQTFPSRRAHQPSRRVVDRLELGVGVERVRAELAAVARLLEAAERRRHPHRRVRVDRQHAGVDGARDPQRLRAVARPDRAREPVDRVVGQRDRLGLGAERDDDRDRAEDLLAHRAVVRVDRAQHGRREPVAGPVGHGALDRDRRVVRARTRRRPRAGRRRSAGPSRSPRRAGRRRGSPRRAPRARP